MDQIWHCLLWTSSHQWRNYKDRRILTEVRQVTQLLCIKAKLSSPLCVGLLFVLVVVWWWCNEALENGFRFVVNTTTVLKHLEICCNFLQKVEDFVLLHSFSICVKKSYLSNYLGQTIKKLFFWQVNLAKFCHYLNIKISKLTLTLQLCWNSHD